MYHTGIETTGKKIVTIGGGTGNSVLLRGVKKFSSNITTIVTVADDGGGSGKLREDLGMLPPGDIRNCLVALANTEPSMENLMNYRFRSGDLQGQNLGNLIIAAMDDMYGDFDVAIKELSQVLAITGKVLPMTLDNVVLLAKLEDGSVIEGESNITFLNRRKGQKIERVFTRPELMRPLQESVDSILDADIVILGPGSLYTSVMPNLLVKDISKALIATKASIVYVCNVMSQPGETDNYSVSDHVNAIIKHIGKNVIDKIVVNTEKLTDYIAYKYKSEENSIPIILTEKDRKYLNDMGIEIIEGKILNVKYDYIRHDADEVIRLILESYDNENKVSEN